MGETNIPKPANVMANHDLMQLAVLRVRFRIQEVCQSVQSGAFTLPNCFLKSHKRDLQNVLSLAKTEHIISPSDLMRFSITFEFFSEYFLFEVPGNRRFFSGQEGSPLKCSLNILSHFM